MIELQKACVAYDKTPVFLGLTCVFPKNEFTCIIGKNGSGKSTLLRAMAGLIPYGGSILLGGREIKCLPKKERARELSYLPQLRTAPVIDVQTLIAHGRFPHLGFSKTLTMKDREMIQYAAEVAGVVGLLNRPVATLSGGERQRAYIAMTVAQDADIMLLDEPTAYLDIEHQLEVMELLARLRRRGKGVVMVAHDLPQAFSYAGRIALIAEGALAAQGSPETLCENGSLYRAFGVSLKKTEDEGELYSYRLMATSKSQPNDRVSS